MINKPSQKDLNKIESIFQHFQDKFPSISSKDLYDRIYKGYCWLGSEGSINLLISIEAWDKVFSGDEDYTVFKDWKEYLKYEGNVSKHPKFIAQQELSQKDSLVSTYTLYNFLYNLSLGSRIEMDLGYTHYNINLHPKELYKFSKEELKEKIKSLKAPWWHNSYEKFLKKNRILLLLTYHFPFIGKIYLRWILAKAKKKEK